MKYMSPWSILAINPTYSIDQTAKLTCGVDGRVTLEDLDLVALASALNCGGETSQTSSYNQHIDARLRV
jgi:hypothetical protein